MPHAISVFKFRALTSRESWADSQYCRVLFNWDYNRVWEHPIGCHRFELRVQHERPQNELRSPSSRRFRYWPPWRIKPGKCPEHRNLPIQRLAQNWWRLTCYNLPRQAVSKHNSLIACRKIWFTGLINAYAFREGRMTQELPCLFRLVMSAPDIGEISLEIEEEPLSRKSCLPK